MKEFILTINIEEYSTFRNACIKACNITPQAWSTWRLGKVKVPSKYHEKINKVAMDLFGREVWKGGEE